MKNTNNLALLILRTVKRFFQGALANALPVIYLLFNSEVPLSFLQCTLISLWFIFVGFIIEKFIVKALDFGAQQTNLDTHEGRIETLKQLVVAGMDNDSDNLQPERRLLVSILSLVYTAQEKEKIFFLYSLMTSPQVLSELDPDLNKELIQARKKAAESYFGATPGKQPKQTGDGENKSSEDNNDIFI